MRSKPSHAFEKFLASLNAPSQYQDRHYDPSWLRLADPAERESGIDLLVERVRTADDSLAARALAELGCRRALPDLTSLAQRLQGTGAAPTVHVALLRIDPSPVNLAHVMADAQRGERESLHALADSGEPDARLGLIAIMENKDASLRSLAFEGLVKAWGLQALRGDSLSPLNALETQLASNQAALRAVAVQRIRSIDGALSQGHSAAELGLPFDGSGDEAFQNLVSHSIRDDAPLPAALHTATGHAREWLEALMAVRLDPDIRDPRAARLLGELDASWSVPVLQAAILGAPAEHPFVSAVREAVARLQTPDRGRSGDGP